MTLDQILIEAYQQADYTLGFLPLIAAGISAIGGIAAAKMANKPQKTTSKTESTVDYAEMVKRASAAGFNPLTAIRNGGSAGFSTTSGTTIGSGGGGGMGQAIAGFGAALSDAISAMGQRNDPIKVKSQRPDTALVDYQLRGAVRRPAGALYPVTQSTGVKVQSSAPVRKLPNYLEDGQLTNTDPWRWTKGWIEASPTRTDGANYEDAYGEFMGGLTGGIIPPVQDIYHNVTRVWRWAEKNDRENYKKYRAERKAYNVVPKRRPPPPGYRYAN